MKILLLSRYGRLGASSRLRSYQYVDHLEAAGFAVDVQPFFSNEYVASLSAGRASVRDVVQSYGRRVYALAAAKKYDVVWTEKELFPWIFPSIERLLSRHARKLVVDIDDAVFHRYDRHRNRFVRGLLGNKIDDVMERSALVTAGNGYLAERARAAGARAVEVVPTVVDLHRYPRYRPAKEPVGDLVVGWIGSPSTATYLSAISPSLPTSINGRSIAYVAIGARPDQLIGTPFNSIPWSEDREVALLSNLDVGIMPLLDTPWERGKCGYKLIQYMACGVPVIASPVGVNGSIVGNAGLLASTGEEWRAAIETLMADVSMRHAMGENGRLSVERTYSLQAQAPRLVKLLQDIASI